MIFQLFSKSQRKIFNSNIESNDIQSISYSYTVERFLFLIGKINIFSRIIFLNYRLNYHHIEMHLTYRLKTTTFMKSIQS